MHANGWLVVVAATLLGLSALGDAAEAGRCRPGRPCDGWQLGQGYLDFQVAPDFGRKVRRARSLPELFAQAVDSDEMIADNGSFIPKSMAVAQVLAAYPNGRALSVKLSYDPGPVYVVTLKVDGQVLYVHVDPQSGQILGQ